MYGTSPVKTEKDWQEEEARHRQLKTQQAKQRIEEKENAEVHFHIQESS